MPSSQKKESQASCNPHPPAPTRLRTWALAWGLALDLLADEAAEQAGQRAELGEVLHVVNGNVQRLGRQQPQLGLVSVLHACP